MKSEICSQCGKPKAKLKCGICNCSICKSCAKFVDSDELSFMSERPKALDSSTFCEACYFEKIEPIIKTYEENLEKAKQVNLFYKDQARETRLMSRAAPEIRIENCLDRDETILRLAYRAAELQYNSLIDVDIKSVKVREANYQHSVWSVTGIPLNLDENKLKRK